MSARSTGESTATYTDSLSTRMLYCEGSAPSGTWTTATGICVENGYVPAAVPSGMVPRTIGVSTPSGSRLTATTANSSVSGAARTTDASTWASPVYGMATKSLGRPASVKSDAAENTTCDRPLASVAGHDGDW